MLPYIDERAIRIAAPREQVWTALARHVERSLLNTEGHPLTPPARDRPTRRLRDPAAHPPTRLTLTGRHRFSRDELTFELADARAATTQLGAQSYAAFPGLHGRVYRALVIGSRAHVLATNHMLGSVRRLAEDPAEP